MKLTNVTESSDANRSDDSESSAVPAPQTGDSAWSEYASGDPTTWPKALTDAVRELQAQRAPAVLWWGPQALQFPNASFVKQICPVDPLAIGTSAQDATPAIWGLLKPAIGNR